MQDDVSYASLIAHVIFSFVQGYLARDFRARGASWPDFDQRPPERAAQMRSIRKPHTQR